MKTPSFPKAWRPGYVSYVMVLSVGSMLTLLTISAYKYAAAAQVVQGETLLGPVGPDEVGC